MFLMQYFPKKKKKKLSTEEFYLEKMQQMAKNFTNGV